MTVAIKKERWRVAHRIACELTGNRSPDTALLTIGIMAVDVFERKYLGGVVFPDERRHAKPKPGTVTGRWEVPEP